MFFDTWHDILRILVVGPVAYAGLVVCLRISGKRTLAKMNAFDLVVTVAFGSTFASSLLSSDVAIAEALSAFALLCALQYIVVTLSVRFEWFQNMIKAQPALLFHRGEFIETAMRQERVTHEEILAAMRGSGATDPAQVGAVILETDGTLSILSNPGSNDMTSLRYVRTSPHA